MFVLTSTAIRPGHTRIVYRSYEIQRSFILAVIEEEDEEEKNGNRNGSSSSSSSNKVIFPQQ